MPSFVAVYCTDIENLGCKRPRAPFVLSSYICRRASWKWPTPWTLSARILKMPVKASARFTKTKEGADQG